MTSTDYQSILASKKWLTYMGEGAYREAYYVDADTPFVRKFAFRRCGQYNIREVNHYTKHGSKSFVASVGSDFYRVRLARILDADPEGRWLDMELATPLSDTYHNTSFKFCPPHHPVGYTDSVTLDSDEGGCGVSCFFYHLTVQIEKHLGVIDMATDNLSVNTETKEIIIIDYGHLSR